MTDLPATPVPENDVEKIKAILEEIRPYLQRDGGDCEFVSYEDKIVNLKLHGACGTCPSSLMTLRMGIENAIREQVPDVQMVRNVDQPVAHGGHTHPPGPRGYGIYG
ncbi:MAG: NifU family protein [Planctomycetes bacterium]|nr:NifU family protein [Planctomycetota bacterium]